MSDRYHRRQLLRATARAATGLTGLALLTACGQGGAAASPTIPASSTARTSTATTASAAVTKAATSAASASQTATSAATVSTTIAPAAPTPTAAAKVSGQRAQLEYLVDSFNPDEEKRIQGPLRQDFEQKNPQYTFQPIFSKGSTVAAEKYTTMLAGGTPPDLLYLTFPHFTFAADGDLLDFSPYAAQDKTVNWDTDFYPRVTEYYKIPAGGFWALPQNYATEVFFYNTKILQDAGHTPPSATYTYDQLLADAQALVQRSSSDTTRWGLMVRLTRIDQILWAYGGAFIDDQATKSRITEPGSIAALQYISDLMNKWQVMPSKGNQLQLFQQSKLALAFITEWAVPIFNKVSDLDYDIALMPKGPAGQFTWLGPGGVAASKATKHPEGAYALARWFVWDDVPVLTLNSPAGDSPTAKVKANEHYWNQMISQPQHRALALRGPDIGKIPFFWQPHGERLTDPVFKGLQPLWDGKATAEQVAAQLDPQINAILKQPLQLKKS